MSFIRFTLLLAVAASLPLTPGGPVRAGIRYGESVRAPSTAVKNTPAPPGGISSDNTEPYKVLVFSKTAGFRHDSIPAAVAAIRTLGSRNNFVVDAVEDGAAFNDANLARYKAVVFLLTTGDVLDATQQAAFERYIRGGNGYVGVHSASDTEYDWPWYGGLVGAYFQGHPAIQTATIRLEDRQHPSTRPLPEPWVRRDEWYNFRTNPRANVRVLARLDEATYSGGTMGDHPIAWYHAFDGGRAWYTAGGHTAESYSEPLFLEHLLGGINYAAGAQTSTALTLLAEENSTGAIALDAVTFTRGPFGLSTPHNFSPDGRTRIMLFAVNLELGPGEGIEAVTARAEDSQQRIFQLPVEYVGTVPNFNWLTQINLKLPGELAGTAEAWVSISLHGATSNKVLIRLSPG
jgi:type 1 glutamine amidotransferase